MTYLLIKQYITDFVSWKNSFDQFLEYRRISGELSCEIYQTNGNQNVHMILSQWESVESAQDFLNSQSFEMIKELEKKEPVSIEFHSNKPKV